MSNFLFLEPAIKARLRASLDTAQQQTVRIFSAPELAAVDGTLPVPCVIVIFDDYRMTETAGNGKRVRLIQNWLAVVAVRSHASLKSGDASRTHAGDIADTVINALMGHQFDGCSKPAMLTNPPKANYEDGFFYLPVSIEAEITRAVP